MVKWSNYRKGHEFVCQANWTLNWWMLGKLTCEGAKDEILDNMHQCERALRAVSHWEALMQEREEKKEQLAVKASVSRHFRPSAATRSWMHVWSVTVLPSTALPRAFPSRPLWGSRTQGRRSWHSPCPGPTARSIAMCRVRKSLIATLSRGGNTGPSAWMMRPPLSSCRSRWSLGPHAAVQHCRGHTGFCITEQGLQGLRS